MSKGGGRKPSYPDWRQLVGRDVEYNRLNEVGPLGSSRYEQGDDGHWTRIMEYSPMLQQALNSQLNALNKAHKSINTPVSQDSVMRGLDSRRRNEALANMLTTARDKWGY